MTFELIICAVVVMLAGALTLTACLAARPRPLFVVKVRRGSACLVRGEVSRAFVRQVRQIIERDAINRGTCSGYAEGRFVRLRFSNEFGASGRQQIRNWMASYGGCGAHHVSNAATGDLKAASLGATPSFEPEENGPSVPYVSAAVFSSRRQYRSKNSLPCSAVT